MHSDFPTHPHLRSQADLGTTSSPHAYLPCSPPLPILSLHVSLLSGPSDCDLQSALHYSPPRFVEGLLACPHSNRCDIIGLWQAEHRHRRGFGSCGGRFDTIYWSRIPGSPSKYDELDTREIRWGAECPTVARSMAGQKDISCGERIRRVFVFPPLPSFFPSSQEKNDLRRTGRMDGF